MKTVSVYDPPQCCATGACSPDQDDTLAQFAAALDWLRTQGVEVSRYNLGHQPGAFVENALVKSTIDKEGMRCLPMVVIDGTIARKGGYMTRQEMAATLGLAAVPDAPAGPVKMANCCGR
jgi:hypothetical protein